MNTADIPTLTLLKDALLDLTNRAVILTDTTGMVLAFNATARQWLGYSAEEVVGHRCVVDFLVWNELVERARNLSDVIGHEVAPGFPILLAHGLQAEGEESEWSLQDKKGNVFSASLLLSVVHDNEGDILGLALLASDITERRRTLAALRESEERYRSVVDVMEEGILLQSADGQVLTCNESAEKLLGLTMAQMNDPYLPGSPWDAINENGLPFPPDQYPLAVTLRTGRACSHVVMGLRKPNGQITWLSINSRPLRRPGEDRPNAVMMSFTDITERKQFETDLAQARDAALDAARLKAAFLANASHEIRTPLNGIVGISDLLTRTPLDDEQRGFIRTLQNSAHSLREIIDDLLDLSKIEAGKFGIDLGDMDIRQIVGDVLDLLAPRTQTKNIELVAIIAPEVPTLVSGDAGRIRQVLNNLLSNALKFTEEGEVVVRVECAGESATDITLRFVVSDTGTGIALQDQKRIFEPFWQGESTAKRGYASTGLGLAITRQLVELMGGTIGVQSGVGKGSVFTFTVRLKKGRPLSLGESAPTIPVRWRGRSVLVAVEQGTLHEMLGRLLREWELHPIDAINNVEALAMLRRSQREASPVALVITDALVDSNNTSLVQAIRGDVRLRETPVVLLHSAGNAAESEGDVDARIAKPIRPEKLLAIINNLLEGNNVSTAALPSAPNEEHKAIGEGESGDATAPVNILLVEDDVVNQQVALYQLRDLGFQVQIANNGFEALDQLQRGHFDVILMDCQMPELDGYQTTAEIRHREESEGIEDGAERAYIIALTAYALRGDRDRCLAAGMNDYLSKPVQMDDLKAAIERGLEIRRTVHSKQTGTSSARANLVGEEVDEDGSVPVIDPQKLNALRNTGTKSNLFAELVGIYLQDVPQRLKGIREALKNKETPIMARHAHTIRGSSSHFGAARLMAACSDLEKSVQLGDSNLIETRLARVETEFEAVKERLNAELSDFSKN